MKAEIAETAGLIGQAKKQIQADIEVRATQIIRQILESIDLEEKQLAQSRETLKAIQHMTPLEIYNCTQVCFKSDRFGGHTAYKLNPNTSIKLGVVSIDTETEL